jgi:DnaK suppressor protein
MSAVVTPKATKKKATAAPARAPAKKAAPAAKPAVKAAPRKTPAKTAVQSLTAKKAAAPAKKIAGATAKPAKTGKAKTSMRDDNAIAGIGNTMKPNVVPRASEVATNTMNQTPAMPSDGTLLTEEQILRMSEKDYMNAAQLAFFKARLQQLERDLRKNADETTEHLRETVLVPDPADRATIEEEHALELRTRDRERKLLKKVQQSLAAIESGDYGWCEETGEPIGIPRLLARPTATLSLEAQQRRELKQKMYGD